MDLSPALKNIDQMVEHLIAFLPQLVLAVLAFALAWMIAGKVRAWVREGVQRAVRGPDLGTAMGQLAFGAVLVVGALVATAIMGVGIGSVLAGMGITGFVIGFALKDVLENYVAGLLLLFSRPFESGDEIRSGAFCGQVAAISTRATTIVTHDGQTVIIPNAQIFTSPLVNETRAGRRQGTLVLKLPPGGGLAGQLQELAARVALVEGVLPEPAPQARAIEVLGDGVKVELSYWTRPRHAEVGATHHAVALALHDALYAPAMVD